MGEHFLVLDKQRISNLSLNTVNIINTINTINRLVKRLLLFNKLTTRSTTLVDLGQHIRRRLRQTVLRSCEGDRERRRLLIIRGVVSKVLFNWP
jgi:hypothetical protein